MLAVVQIPSNEVAAVEWTGDYIEYDTQLCQLGAAHDKFILFNPWLEDQSLIHYVDEIPPNCKCIVWVYKGEWVAKFFDSAWKYEDGSKVIEIVKPKFSWNKNQNLDKLMTFEDDPFVNFEPDYWDSSYELTWYLDPRVNPSDDKVWAIKCRPIGIEVKGTKDMGYVMPNINVEYNDDLPDLGVDKDQCYPPYWDLDKECAWELDPIYTPNKRMWVIKFEPAYRKAKVWEWYGTVAPDYHIEYNPVLSKLNYDLDFVIPNHDFGFEHVWMLDRKHIKNGEDDIWAFKIRVTDELVGSKVVDYISPTQKVKYNLALPKMNYVPDYVIPWHDLAYEHSWHMNDAYRVWVLKVSTTDDVVGTKEMEIPTPDVVFISYHEANAEKNWQRVLEKAPNAKRVNGVKGIFNAHKAAAKLVNTDMFYVVDGDAYLVDDFKFDYQPSIYDRECTHIWRAKNPINGLVYGYGGVKLFSKTVLKKTKAWTTLDLSTTITSRLKIINIISNITSFDTDPMSVWRSAFRECVKLCYNVLVNPNDAASQTRLEQWLNEGTDHTYGQYARDAAQHAVDWVTNNKDDYDLLRMINSREWIEEQFKKAEDVKKIK